MKEKIIKIDYDVEDTYFKFPQQAMADIVDALHKNNKVILRFTEGVALGIELQRKKVSRYM